MKKRPVEKRFDVCYSITGEVAAFSVDISACVAWLGGEFSQLDVCRKGRAVTFCQPSFTFVRVQ